MTDEPASYLDTSEAAAFLRLSPATLITWRSRRTGPPFLKLGSRVVYAVEALREWAASKGVTIL